MRIGAHALILGVTLVTNTTREFKQIRHLKVVNWSAEAAMTGMIENCRFKVW
jgi:predicted nucleic acid-binding protein